VRANDRGFQARAAAAASSQMSDQKNTILAIVLSALVLIVWQVYFGVPQMEKQKQIQQQQAQERSQQPPTLPQQTPGTVPHTPPPPPPPPPAPNPRTGPAAPASPGNGAAGARPRRDRGAADYEPGRRARSLSARAHRDAEPLRLDFAQRRTHRRPLAGQIPRDRRPEFAADRAARALGHPASVLSRIRL